MSNLKVITVKLSPGLVEEIDAAAGAGKRTAWIAEACRLRLIEDANDSAFEGPTMTVESAVTGVTYPKAAAEYEERIARKPKPPARGRATVAPRVLREVEPRFKGGK